MCVAFKAQLLLKRGTLFPLLCKLPSPKPETYLKLSEGFLKSKSIILSYSYCWVRIKSIAEGVIKSNVVTKIQIYIRSIAEKNDSFRNPKQLG